jgi:hypothetical protein
MDMKYLISLSSYYRERYFPNRKLDPEANRELEAHRNATPAFVTTSYSDKASEKGTAVILSSGYLVEIEIVYAKCLEIAGYRPVILMLDDRVLDRKRFDLAGVPSVTLQALTHLVRWNQDENTVPGSESLQCYDDIKNLEYGNSVKVGMNALATFLRETRAEKLDFENPSQVNRYQRHLAASVSYAKIANAVINRLKPALFLMNDRVYSPVAELFQMALSKGIRVITRNASQATGYEILKGYHNPDAIYTHPHSLSQVSWEKVKSMPWSEENWCAFDAYMRSAYSSGDWFAEVGTQFNKSMVEGDQLEAELGLHPGKPTAVVFSHIFWDGTLSYGIDLFDHYCDWFSQVARIAAQQDSVNWIFKVHPANLVKASREGIAYEAAEIRVLKESIGEIPGHIKILESDSEISTYSLFSIMDYCLTVRGTIGIESAAYGIKTLTAGTGRYDRLGFTADFDSREAYLEAIKNLSSIPPMTDEEIGWARRFAWAIFKMRHIPIDPLNWTVERNETASQEITFKQDMNKENFKNSEFVVRVSRFFNSEDEDVLIEGC